MGAKKGPATTATDGKTRCVTCHDSYGQRLAKLNNAAADLLNAATAARIYVGAAIEYSRTAKELFGMLDAAIKKADQ